MTYEQEQYISNINEQLRKTGINPDTVILSSEGYVEVDSIIDLELFNVYFDLNVKNKLCGFSNQDGASIIFSFVDKELEYTDNDFENLSKAENITRQLLAQAHYDYINSIKNSYENKSLDQCIPNFLKENLNNCSSLKDIENWKIKIILNNSCGNELQIGDLDTIGYVLIGINTGTIIPIARNDEHNRGFDCLHHYIEQGLVPNDHYYAMANSFLTYANSLDMVALTAMKIWRKFGGKNMILRDEGNHKGPMFQLTIDDYINNEANIILNKGKLLPIGERFIKNLSNLSKLISSYHLKPTNNIKQIFKQAYVTINHYNAEINLYKPIDLNILNSMEFLEETDSIAKLEQMFFGFDGIKNDIHNQIRKALAEPNHWNSKDMNQIFGDLDYANHCLSNM